MDRAIPRSISWGTRPGNRCMMWWIDPQCRKTDRNYGWGGSGRPGFRTLMKRINRFLALVSVSIVGAATVYPQNQFPIWRGRQTTLMGLWEATPIVVVGDLRNVSEIGVQTMEKLPWPVEQDLHRLFWCRAELRVESVIKGTTATGRRKYVWASVNPGCRIFSDHEAEPVKRGFRAWFVREEGDSLRPTFDGGSRYHLGFHTRWNRGARTTLQEELGMSLLTPAANTRTNREFADAIWDQADVACALLGKARCVAELRALSRVGDKALQTAACEYLRAQQGESCQH